MAQNSYWVPSKLRSYFLCSSQGSGRRTFDKAKELVTATSMARPLPSDQMGIDTSPGRRPEVGPRIPFFSKTGASMPSSAMRLTTLRTVLWRTMRSPDFAQQKSIDSQALAS